jgi:hypothetical protein
VIGDGAGTLHTVLTTRSHAVLALVAGDAQARIRYNADSPPHGITRYSVRINGLPTGPASSKTRYVNFRDHRLTDCEVLRFSPDSATASAESSTSIDVHASTGMPVRRSIRMAFVNPGVRRSVSKSLTYGGSNSKYREASAWLNPRRRIQSLN